MKYIERNVNPSGKRVGDCVIRAISTVMNADWDHTYIDLMLEGFAMKDLHEVMAVMDEIMETLRLFNPKLYYAAMRKLATL